MNSIIVFANNVINDYLNGNIEAYRKVVNVIEKAKGLEYDLDIWKYNDLCIVIYSYFGPRNPHICFKVLKALNNNEVYCKMIGKYKLIDDHKFVELTCTGKCKRICENKKFNEIFERLMREVVFHKI